MRLTTFTVFVATLLSAVANTYGADRITVDPGDLPRRNVPVSAMLDGISLNDGPVTLTAAGESLPGQVERTSGGVILRWIEPELQPRKPKTYDVIPAQEQPGFTFVEGAGYRDLKLGDRGVYRHMNRYDPAGHVGTFKPFHHVFDMHGEGFITNGPGSEEWGKSGEGIRYPHHRGLFFAYNKTPYGDFWHGKDGVSQRHKEYKKDREITGPVVAREMSVNEWTTKDGKPIIRDTRELTTWHVIDTTYVLDFDVTLESLTGEAISLTGDSQHAGFHFRAANSVGQDTAATKPAAKPTTRGNTGGNAIYTRPATAVAKGNDVWAECPWVYAAFTIEGHPYGVSEMNAPTNPQPTVFSTRPYGRFGAFVNDQEVAPNKPLKLKYRFIVRDATETPAAKQLEQEYQDWVTPVKVTVAK